MSDILLSVFDPVFTVWAARDLGLAALVFVWSGFVRAGLGFGGAALTLPFLLMLEPDPVFWLPVIGWHLLFFTSLTLYRRWRNVDGRALMRGLKVMWLPKLAGVFGLISLPSTLLAMMVYLITLAYGLAYLSGVSRQQATRVSGWRDAGMLVLGGYVSGTSLVGAPLIAAVAARHIEKARLRDTLYSLWIVLVVIKMSTFVVFDVSLQWQFSLVLLPAAALGNLIGLRVHDYLVANEGGAFQRWIGAGLVLVCLIGIARVVLTP